MTKAELIFNNFDLLCQIALFLDAEDLRCAKLIVRAMSIPLARQGDLSLVDALARHLVHVISGPHPVPCRRSTHTCWITCYEHLLHLKHFMSVNVLKVYTTHAHICLKEQFITGSHAPAEVHTFCFSQPGLSPFQAECKLAAQALKRAMRLRGLRCLVCLVLADETQTTVSRVGSLNQCMLPAAVRIRLLRLQEHCKN